MSEQMAGDKTVLAVEFLQPDGWYEFCRIPVTLDSDDTYQWVEFRLGDTIHLPKNVLLRIREINAEASEAKGLT